MERKSLITEQPARTRVASSPPPDAAPAPVVPVSPADEPFHRKYRPKSFDSVLGQDEVTRSLSTLMNVATKPHTYLFTGPSGTGKTTLARILAKYLKVEVNNIYEADAATNTGIDAMRVITDTLRYKGFGDTPNRLIILDEVHALSKAAWQSLLKSLEEPPEHVFFALCTTEPSKVPDTVMTRCVAYNLKPVRFSDLQMLVEFVNAEEKVGLAQDILDLVARQANGSPRAALTALAKVSSCRNTEEAARLLEAVDEDADTIELCRLLISRQLDWPKSQRLLQRLKDKNAEGVRITVVNYLNACIIGARNEAEVPALLDMLAAFSRPINPADKLAPIILALGMYIFPPGA